MRQSRLLFMVAVVMMLLSHAAQGATCFYEEFDPGGIWCWDGVTRWTEVELRTTGGNPGGYLYTYMENAGDPYLDAGGVTACSETRGDYIAGGIYKVSFDVKFISGQFRVMWFRVRYRSSSYNGWKFPLTNITPMGTWLSYSIEFDPAWSDAEARAAGWVQESSSPSFSSTMASATQAQIRISGVGEIEAGIDNFRLYCRRGVPLDIKPGSCPNPLNAQGNGNSKAVLPVAILGTDEFDVREIDPETILLEGVSPLRWSYEDVSTPVDKEIDSCACTEEGADGYEDLTLKFDRQEIIAALGQALGDNGLAIDGFAKRGPHSWIDKGNTSGHSGPPDRDSYVLHVEGQLNDGSIFDGFDCVVLMTKGDPAGRAMIESPCQPELSANSPNPFNPSTEIGFSLPSATHVTVDVYNIMGQKVSTLVNGYLPAGQHVVSWDGSDVSSGIYFYRLQTRDFTETKKMLLLK